MEDLKTNTTELDNTNPAISKVKYLHNLQVQKSEKEQGWECSIIGYITVEEVDRDGDLILVDGIEYETYLKNAVLLWGHDKSIPSIGRCIWIKPTMFEGKKALLAKVVFGSSEFAQEIYKAYEEGCLNAFSIGFDTSRQFVREPNEQEQSQYPDCLTVIEHISLHEFSCVNVPANYSALVERQQKGMISNEFQKLLKLEAPEAPKMVESVPEVKPELPKPIFEKIVVKVPVFKKTKLHKKAEVKKVSKVNVLKKLDSNRIIQKAMENIKNRYKA